MQGNKLKAYREPSSPRPTNALEDARREQRVSYRLLVSINDIDIPTSNISVSGAQVCCPSMRYQSLRSKVSRALSVRWTIPRTSYVIECFASIRYSNLCEDEYLIGLEFSNFASEDFRKWSEFVNLLIAERGLNNS